MRAVISLCVVPAHMRSSRAYRRSEKSLKDCGMTIIGWVACKNLVCMLKIRYNRIYSSNTNLRERYIAGSNWLVLMWWVLIKKTYHYSVAQHDFRNNAVEKMFMIKRSYIINYNAFHSQAKVIKQVSRNHHVIWFNFW